MTNLYHAGEQVMTRRGKRGRVNGYADDGRVLVQFGSREFPMREGQIVALDGYSHTSRASRR